MANARISQVQLDQLYDIYDASAVHELADLGLEGYLKFKGAVANMTALNAITGAAVGDVYHVVDIDSEYIWVGGDDAHWEEFGSKLMIDHIHTIPSLSGSIGSNGSAAAQEWTQTSGTISGEAAAQAWKQDTGTISGTAAAQTWTQSSTGNSVTVAGSNAASAVSGSGTVSVPTVSESAKYAKVSTGADTFVKSYPGATSKMVTTSVTGVSGSVSASKATAQDAVAVATVDTAVTVATRASSQTTVGNANVGSETTVATGVTGGSQATWSASVDNEILSFSFTPNTLQSASTTKITPAATSTTKIYGVGGTTSITPAKANGTITPYEFTDVTVPKAATSATTVATGSLASTGTGSAVMTGLGTAVTSSALTSASLASAASSDTGAIHTGDNVTIGSETKTVNIEGTAEAQTWTQGTSSVVIKGTNAASTVSGSATVTGTNTKSTVSGSATVEGTNKASKVTGSISTTASNTQTVKQS